MFGFHLPLKDLESDPRGCVDIALTLGATHLIPPYIEEAERRNSTEFWLGVGQILRDAHSSPRVMDCGALAQSRLRVCGATGWFPPHRSDSRRRRERCGYEIDIGWLRRAGVPAEGEFERYGNRIHAVHVKDTAPEGVIEDDGWVATGDGIIDWKSLLPHIRDTPSKYVVAEHDNPADWRRFAERSIRFIRKVGL